MPNINKVIFGNTTLIDLTDSTLNDPSQLANGVTAYDRTGTKITGTASGGTAAISVVDTTDSHGGTIRTITALDISDTTAVASDVAQGKYFYTAAGVKTAGTGSGGGGGLTQHEIHLEFTDSTDTDIEVDYDDALIATMITAYEPVTYGQKTVDSAALDGTVWYQRPTETWETIYDGDIQYNHDDNNDYPYCFVTDLASVQIPAGSVWRLTYSGNQYRCTAAYDSGQSAIVIGNPKWGGGGDDGSNVPMCFANQGWGAWTGNINAPNVGSVYAVKIERQVVS